MTLLWICELVQQQKEVKVFTFELGGPQYSTDKAHYLYCVEFRKWILAKYGTLMVLNRDWQTA